MSHEVQSFNYLCAWIPRTLRSPYKVPAPYDAPGPAPEQKKEDDRLSVHLLWFGRFVHVGFDYEVPLMKSLV